MAKHVSDDWDEIFDHCWEVNKYFERLGKTDKWFDVINRVKELTS
jgi:hypothetical protein